MNETVDDTREFKRVCSAGMIGLGGGVVASKVIGNQVSGKLAMFDADLAKLVRHDVLIYGSQGAHLFERFHLHQLLGRNEHQFARFVHNLGGRDRLSSGVGVVAAIGSTLIAFRLLKKHSPSTIRAHSGLTTRNEGQFDGVREGPAEASVEHVDTRRDNDRSR